MAAVVMARLVLVHGFVNDERWQYTLRSTRIVAAHHLFEALHEIHIYGDGRTYLTIDST